MYTYTFVCCRMYSTVIGNGRTLQKDMVICGYRIPKGVSLTYVSHLYIVYLINNVNNTIVISIISTI